MAVPLKTAASRRGMAPGQASLPGTAVEIDHRKCYVGVDVCLGHRSHESLEELYEATAATILGKCVQHLYPLVVVILSRAGWRRPQSRCPDLGRQPRSCQASGRARPLSDRVRHEGAWLVVTDERGSAR